MKRFLRAVPKSHHRPEVTQCRKQIRTRTSDSIPSGYNLDNEDTYSGSPNNFQDYQNNFVDSPPDSKESWPVDNCILPSRKRRMEWMSPQQEDTDGSETKIANIEKERDARRKDCWIYVY
ncbi:hypothetical protein ZHAS_00018478 [Anopheles sinensis]|uniref:Uncharacterized protein n=1 Tax=Anopheles sinensis TaxID=74873 RepID=A0A084WJQ3_ANOSI|nr:hypothetical protein ZHAS_00018478 [Anopheles sinensis]